MPLYPTSFPDSEDESGEFDFKKIAASAIAPYPDEKQKMPASPSRKAGASNNGSYQNQHSYSSAAAKMPPGMAPMAPQGLYDHEDDEMDKKMPAVAAPKPPPSPTPRKMTPEEKIQEKIRQENAMRKSNSTAPVVQSLGPNDSGSFLTRPDRMQSLNSSKRGEWNTGTSTPGAQWNSSPAPNRPSATVEAIQAAQPQETSTGDSSSRKRKENDNQISMYWYAALGFGILVAVVLIVVIVMTAVGGDDNGGGTADNVAEKEREPTPNELFVLDLLPEETHEAIDKANSPQAQAFGWMTGDEDLITREYSEEQVQQRFAMATFYYATGGASWKNNSLWLDHSHHECNWHAFFETFDQAQYPCDQQVVGDDSTQHFDLKHLSMPDNGIDGTLPPEIAWLSSLETLNLAENEQLKGTIPPGLGDLTNLTEIDISESSLTGKIPSSLGGLASLTHLILEFNQLTGTVPPQLSNAPLIYLRINRNDFRGRMPYKLCSVRSVTSDCTESFCGCGCAAC